MLVSETNRQWVTFGSIAVSIIALLTIFAIARGSWVFTLIFLSVGTLVAAFFAPRFAVFMRWHPAELHIDSYPMPLGAPVKATYVHRSKKGPPQDASTSLQVRLTCEERATYTVGTETRTDKETVSEQVWSVNGAIRAGVFMADGELTVPLDQGVPTFKTDNNEVRWKLSVTPEEPLPSHDVTFILNVFAQIGEPGVGPTAIQDAPLRPDAGGGS